MTKHSKKEVNYSPGHVQSHCGPVFHDDTYCCQHFQDRVSHTERGTCELVEGLIDARYWCELWKRKKKT